MIWSWTVHSARRRRLDAAQEAFVREKFILSANPAIYAEAVNAALTEADRAKAEGRLNAGWSSLATARRLELLSLRREALEARAAALAIEAHHKLRGWRQDVAAKLLPVETKIASGNEGQDAPRDEGKEVEEPTATAAARAQKNTAATKQLLKLTDEQLRARAWFVSVLLDDTSDNVYFKQDVTSNSVLLLVVLLIVMVMGVLIATSLAPLPPASSFDLLPYVALFGAMGACFSGIRSLLGPNKSAIPETVLSSFSTMVRPMIGAVSAIVVFIAQIAGVLNVAKETPSAVLTVAFIAGFSESLIVRVVGEVEKPGRT